MARIEMRALTTPRGRLVRRALLVGIAAVPVLVQAVTTPRFRITYEAGPRSISLSRPVGDLISCAFRDGTVRVGRDAARAEIRDRIADSRAAGRSTTWWEERLLEVESAPPADGRCAVTASILASLLSRGEAEVTGPDGSAIERIAEWRVAWVYDGRPMFFGEGDGRALLLVGFRYRPDPEGPDCGAGCIVYAGEHQTHSDSVI